ncbi:hypothetical protein G7054_g5003 [Neopestalotiopsis clavispora]|nr:hypothetical protein G7054_g5003 [Neopestalotiopsis clavispora]
MWVSDSEVRVLSTSEGLLEFDEAFKTAPDQRTKVKKLTYHVVLPEVSVKKLKKMQGRAEAETNDAAFTRALSALFNRLSTWDAADEYGLCLSIEAASPTDFQINDLMESGVLVNTHNERQPGIWEGARNLNRYVGLEQGDLALPKATCVSRVEMSAGCDQERRDLHPNVFTAIVNACQELCEISWAFTLPQRSTMQARKSIRSAWAEALQETNFPPSLARVTLDMQDNDPFNEKLELGSLLQDPQGFDDLSLAVRRIAQLPALRTLRLETLWALSPEAFGSHTQLAPLHCPSLEELMIDISMTTPNGQYLMTGDPDQGWQEEGDWDSDDEISPAPMDPEDSDTSDWTPEFAWEKLDGSIPPHTFRSTPDPNTFMPLVSSFADAVAGGHMPRLRKLEIQLGGSVRMCHAPTEIKFFAPGHANRDANGVPGGNEFDEVNRDKPRWYFWGAPGFETSWRLPSDLKRDFEGPNGDGCIIMAIEDERIEI